jgi:hypothetical protein
MNSQKKSEHEPKPVGLLDPKFKYVPAAATDVTQTWKRFGWKPIEQRLK